MLENYWRILDLDIVCYQWISYILVKNVWDRPSHSSLAILNLLSHSRIKICRGGQVLFDCLYCFSIFKAYISPSLSDGRLIGTKYYVLLLLTVYQVSTVTDHKLICCEVLSNRMSSFTLWIMHYVCRKVKRQFVVAKDWSSVAVALAHWSAEKVVLVYCSLFQSWLPIWWSMSLIDCDWLMKHRDWF